MLALMHGASGGRGSSSRASDGYGDYHLSAGVLMAKVSAPPSQQQQQHYQQKQKLTKRRRHSISTTVYHAASSSVMDMSASTTASLTSTASSSPAVAVPAQVANRACSAWTRTPASVTGMVTPMPAAAAKAQQSRRTSFVQIPSCSSTVNLTPSVFSTSPSKLLSQRPTERISSAATAIGRADVSPLPGNACTNDTSRSLSSHSPSSCLSSPSYPVQVLVKQPQSTPTGERSDRRQQQQQELPILRCRYVARDVKVLIGTRWKLQKFETKTVVLLADGSATPALTICSSTRFSDNSDVGAVKFNLALDLTCVHSGPNGLKLKSSGNGDAFRLKIRFTTPADAAIWFNLIHDTMQNARWIKDVEETACLSRDATATVFAARHIPTDQEFVIKVLPNARVDDGSCTEILVLKKLFRAVAGSSTSSESALRHILEYRVIETLKDVRIVMPKFPGKNLLQFLQQQPKNPMHQTRQHQPHHRLGESDARSALLRLCESLHALHSIGIVHCDLKLENILLSDVSNVHVIDFGGAFDFSSANDDSVGPTKLKSRTQQQPKATMIGTPGYIAPERIFFVDEPPTPAADVFSAGIVLFQMLTGRQPFARSSRHRALRMQDATVLHWQSAEKILSSHGVSPAATQLLERMVEQDPLSRITVEEIFCHPWLCS